MNNYFQDNYTYYKTDVDSHSYMTGFEKYYAKLNHMLKITDFETLSDDEKKIQQYMNNELNIYKEKALTDKKSMVAYPSTKPFYNQKKLINSSNLFKVIFSQMPKGALLHVHSCAGLSYEELIELIYEWNKTHTTNIDVDTEIVEDGIYIVAPGSNLDNNYIDGMLLYGKTVKSKGLDNFCKLFDIHMMIDIGTDTVKTRSRVLRARFRSALADIFPY